MRAGQIDAMSNLDPVITLLTRSGDMKIVTDTRNMAEAEKVLAKVNDQFGLGLSWISPVGPLKLSYGTPVKVEPNDRIQKFQFQIGTSF